MTRIWVLRGIRRGARVSALTGRFPASRSAVQAPEIRDGTTTIEGDFDGTRGRLSQRTAEAVSCAIIGTLAPIQHLVHTLTADNRKEFAEQEIIAIACNANFYFAEPYASWQRGSNENGNSLVRSPDQGQRIRDRQ